jgi:hypothetical protein
MMGIGERAYNSLRSRTPRSLRKPLAHAAEGLSALTGSLRSLPTFIIVGGQRCGTNSLYEYLVSHPNVRRALPGQEVHFFDFNVDRGLTWYRGHFPIRVKPTLSKLTAGSQVITGECSPYYMFHPLAPSRIADLLPDVKLLALVRNPIDRAFSHYHHERTRGVETLSFEKAINEETERLRGEVEKMRRDPNYYSFNHHHFSYVERGKYADQLDVLYSLFPRENIMVLFSEEFFKDPAAAHLRALEFLGLPPFFLSEYPTYNPGRYTDMDPQIRSRLTDEFAEANARLYRLLDTNYRWD